MGVTVELFRESDETRRGPRLTFSLNVWEFLRDLGKTFGWSPTGTTYVVPPKRKIETPALHNYQPGDALDRKQVEAEDAGAWANALILARRSPHFAAMIDAQSIPEAVSREAGMPLPNLLDEFIEFAQGGAFTFAVSTTEGG